MNALPRMVKDSSNLLAVVAASLAGRDPRQALERWTTWGSEKPRSPQVPFSTPMPLHLAPPKGWWGASARWVLTHAVPHYRFSEICVARSTSAPHRSEEHTSEIQSIMRNSYAVFCLKKKKQKRNRNKHNKVNKKNRVIINK